MSMPPTAADPTHAERAPSATDPSSAKRAPTTTAASGAKRAPSKPLPPIEMEDDVHGLDAAGWRALTIGLALAVASLVVPLLETLVGYFVVLVHEMGHAGAGWLFGYPSLPAFDFRYGGGVTTHAGTQWRGIVWLVLAALVVLGWAFRGNRLTLGVVASCAVLYSSLAFTHGHEAVIVAFGHGGELLFAFVFLQRAFTGSACKVPAERPLYAWIGFYIVFYSTGFAWRLATSAIERQKYADAKGGGHWMDFSRLAREHFDVSLESVAATFLVLCLLTPALAFAYSWVAPWRDELRVRLGSV